MNQNSYGSNDTSNFGGVGGANSDNDRSYIRNMQGYNQNMDNFVAHNLPKKSDRLMEIQNLQNRAFNMDNSLSDNSNVSPGGNSNFYYARNAQNIRNP